MTLSPKLISLGRGIKTIAMVSFYTVVPRTHRAYTLTAVAIAAVMILFGAQATLHAYARPIVQALEPVPTKAADKSGKAASNKPTDAKPADAKATREKAQ